MAALAAGGYTFFVDMPLNNLPVTTTVEAFDLKLAAMRRSAKVDFGLWGGLVPGNLDQLAPMVERGGTLLQNPVDHGTRVGIVRVARRSRPFVRGVCRSLRRSTALL